MSRQKSIQVNTQKFISNLKESLVKFNQEGEVTMGREIPRHGAKEKMMPLAIESLYHNHQGLRVAYGRVLPCGRR